MTRKILKFLKNDWPSVVMLCFVVAATSLYTMGKQPAAEAAQGREAVMKIDVLDAAKLQARQDAISGLAVTNTPAYLLLVAVNMSIMLVILLGLVAQGYLFYAWRSGKTIIVRSLEPPPPAWGISDVLRIVLRFYSIAFILAAWQGIMVHRGYLKFLEDYNLNVAINSIFMDIIGIMMVLEVVRDKYRQDIRALGLHTKQLSKNILYGVGGYLALIPLALFTLVITVLTLAKFNLTPPMQPIVDMIVKEKNFFVLALFAVFAAVIGPVMEEIFFRAFAYNAIKKKIGAFWGVMIMALVFSALHMHPVGLAPIFFLGVLLSVLYEKTGSLVPSIAVHVIHNTASLGLVYLVRTFDFLR